MKRDPALPYLTLSPGFVNRSGGRGLTAFPVNRLTSRRKERRWRGEVRIQNRRLWRHPNDAFALHWRGIARMRLGRPSLALRDFDRTISIDPTSASDHFERGNALFDLGRFEAAAEAYGRAIELGFGYAVAFYNRGLSRSKLNRIEEALVDYGEALRMKPDYADALHNRNNLLSEPAAHEGEESSRLPVTLA